jgi:hypothetical protein
VVFDHKRASRSKVNLNYLVSFYQNASPSPCCQFDFAERRRAVPRTPMDRNSVAQPRGACRTHCQNNKLVQRFHRTSAGACVFVCDHFEPQSTPPQAHQGRESGAHGQSRSSGASKCNARFVAELNFGSLFFKLCPSTIWPRVVAKDGPQTRSILSCSRLERAKVADLANSQRACQKDRRCPLFQTDSTASNVAGIASTPRKRRAKPRRRRAQPVPQLDRPWPIQIPTTKTNSLPANSFSDRAHYY